MIKLYLRYIIYVIRSPRWRPSQSEVLTDKMEFKIMNIFFSDCHPENITIFTDLIVGLDEGYDRFTGLDKKMFEEIKAREEVPHLGDLYTKEVYQMFHDAIIQKYPAMSYIKMTWKADGRHGKFFIDGYVINTKQDFWNEIKKHVEK